MFTLTPVEFTLLLKQRLWLSVSNLRIFRRKHEKQKEISPIINDISYLINKWENSNKPVIKTKKENQNSCTSYASSKNYA